METISKSTLTFIKDLHANNDREWFMKNKPRYEQAKTSLKHL
ncbi:MAG: DUF2461 domain-containing protein [Chloroflexia bacterium]|nr:DUF2461 domain-containing protein [Chloroflexia bacterium]